MENVQTKFQGVSFESVDIDSQFEVDNQNTMLFSTNSNC